MRGSYHTNFDEGELLLLHLQLLPWNLLNLFLVCKQLAVNIAPLSLLTFFLIATSITCFPRKRGPPENIKLIISVGVFLVFHIF
jgi:hypothetical protein